MRLIPTRVVGAVFDVAVWVTCGLALFLLPLRIGRKLFSKSVRSLWTGTPIINMSINCRAERLLGVDARSLVFSTYYITDAFDYNLSRFTAIPILGRLVPISVFLWACIGVDRLHCYCDRGILPPRGLLTFDFRELQVYRLLGMEVFLWTYGADVRNQVASRAAGLPNACTDCDAPGRYCICDERKAAENLSRLSCLSRAIFSGMGDMFGYTRGSVDNLFYWPVDLDARGGERYRPVYPVPSADRPLRIVHAPNHRMFKGTRFLVDAVDSLRRDGEDIELVLVERMPNEQALELYRTADVIFDQCIMGNYGFFAIESMALGKPVMCFIRHPLRYLLQPDECPIINTHIDTLKEDIRRLVRERHLLPEVGRRGRRYVERHFSIEAFAERLGRIYRDLGVAPCR